MEVKRGQNSINLILRAQIEMSYGKRLEKNIFLNYISQFFCVWFSWVQVWVFSPKLVL